MLGLFIPIVSFAQSLPGDVDPNGNPTECITLNNNLRYQTRDSAVGGEVSTLQDFLQSQGFLSTEPTGYFGLITFKAVKDFQSANGVQPTGYVGPITRAKIHDVSCSTSTTAPTLMPTNGCPPGTIYSSVTGQLCANPKFPPGCNSYDGFSSVQVAQLIMIFGMTRP